MREKIRIILAECWNKVGGQVETTTKLEALFTAETAALREEIKNLESTIDGLMNGGKV